MSVTIRPTEQNDVESSGKIGYLAHRTISSAHGHPSEQPSEVFGTDRIKTCRQSKLMGFSRRKERQYTISIFIHKFSLSPVVVIGPLTVNRSAEGGGIGRLLMEIALDNFQ